MNQLTVYVDNVDNLKNLLSDSKSKRILTEGFHKEVEYNVVPKTRGDRGKTKKKKMAQT